MKKTLNLAAFYFLLLGGLVGQVTASATADSGSGYPALINSGFEIENPDCVHGGFGAHVTQAYDSELDRNIFVFHSHIEADNDRCQVFDRVRMEIKGSATTIPELQHDQGDTTYYRWKFRLSENFTGANTFCHLFQNKIKGGNDDSFPVITLTARATVLEVMHSGGNSGTSLGTLAAADLDQFIGEWVEVYLRQVHAENGELHVIIKDMSTGQTIIEYSNDNIDLWRAGATLSRPKFGVYRAKNIVLEDEEVRFADFCVSEESEALCPGEAVLQIDTVAPTQPTGLIITNTTFTTLSLEWEDASDDFGVTGYEVYANDDSLTTVAATAVTIENLPSNTTYSFKVRAFDEAANFSEFSSSVVGATDDPTATPDPVSTPEPDNGALNVSLNTSLNWQAGNNTDEFELFFGTTTEPPFIGVQQLTTFQPELQANTTYFWRVVANNVNGSTSSPVWTFTTGADNNDFPWYVFRGNARPEVETNFFFLNSEPDNPLLDEVFPDPDYLGNNLYGYRTNTENFRWRFDLTDQDSLVTLVTRIKGIDNDANGMMHIDLRAFGWRQKVRINSSSIKFERSDPELEVDLPFNWNEAYHTLRLVAEGSQMTAYVDENPDPILTGLSAEQSAINFLEFGRSGGANYGAFVDWLGLNITEVSPPFTGTNLPEDLIVSNDASLATLLVNGINIDTFSPNLTEYIVPVLDGEPLPVLSYETSFAGATTTEELPTEIPGTAVIRVVAQDGQTERNYMVSFELASGVFDPAFQAMLSASPNPASQEILLKFSSEEEATVTIWGLGGGYHGQRLARSGERFDVSRLPGGSYLFIVRDAKGRKGKLKIIVE